MQLNSLPQRKEQINPCTFDTATSDCKPPDYHRCFENGRIMSSATTNSNRRRRSVTSLDINLNDVRVTKRVKFNVGGTTFETTEQTYQQIQETYFKDSDFLSQFYDSARDEFFFDRDPEVFRAVLNYWRTGRLHIPTTMCGPQVLDEMEFWGLSPMKIESCCFNTYSSCIKSMCALQKLERDRQISYLKPKIVRPTSSDPLCRRVSLSLWYLLTDPSYSRWAKIYAYVSLFFVILAIFSFCASTHETFRVPYSQSPSNGTTTPLTANNNNNTQSNSINNTPSNSTANPNGLFTLSVDNTNTNIIPCQKNSEKEDVDLMKDTDKKKKNKTLVQPILSHIDLVCVILFTLEYVIRLICAPDRCSFIFSFTAIIDFLAIMPDYIEFIVFALYPENSSTTIMQFMPFLRLMRVFRIFRLAQRVPGLWIMIYTLRASYKELSLMLMFLLVGTLFFSSVIYFVDDDTIFQSIPHSFWWAIVTMTTVGYGDMTPVTAWGRIVGSVTAICGVLLVGFTIPALVNNFITYCQFVEFAMRNEDTIANDFRRLSGVDRKGRDRKRKRNKRLNCRTPVSREDSVKTEIDPETPTSEFSWHIVPETKS